MISDRLRTSLKESFRDNMLPKLGLALLLILLFMSVFAPFLATHDPTAGGHTNEDGVSYPPIGTEYETTISVDGERTTVTAEGTTEHLLGTNSIGQDVFSRFIYGARISIIVGLLGVGIAVLLGVPYGLVAGYFGGRVDDALMRVADVMLAFPALVLALALLGAFGTSEVPVPDPFVYFGLADGMPETIPIPGTVTIVVGLVSWVWFARVARGEVLSIRNKEYIKAAKSFGAGDGRILLRHVVPNSLTPIIVLATIQIAVVILLEASLAYLGFSGTTLSWGFDVSNGEEYLSTMWWIAVFPGVGIMLAVISVNLLGDWLRDALDPNVGEGSRGA